MLRSLYFVPAELNKTFWAKLYEDHILNANMKPIPQEMHCFSFLIDFDFEKNYPQLLHDYAKVKLSRLRKFSPN